MRLKELLDDLKRIENGPVGMLMYCLETENNIEFRQWSLKFSDEEKNLDKMREIVQMPGFMFFLHSEEGIRFLEKNNQAILDYVMGKKNPL